MSSPAAESAAAHLRAIYPAIDWSIEEGFGWFSGLEWWQALLVIAAIIVGVALVMRVVGTLFKIAIIVIAVILIWQTGLLDGLINDFL